ncbi:ABC transporter ATP-binding protein [Capnocytophaga sp. ARDL2]|uniref:ABC transporter ATP-binding protein n=1 Tax=Capnocytophaga sp. ARDL2 TaxID=3238809 RepID=UPI0035578BAE
MIQTTEIQFSYPQGSSFSFPAMTCNAGETLLITGSSGTGKTTFLHLLSGLLTPTSGEIKINNQDITKLKGTDLDSFRGKNIGLVLQKSYFVNALNVLENIETASWLSNKNKNTEKAKELLQQLGLSDHITKNPSELSVGQQQRVNIARALINEPKIILADEPSSSLDDENAQIVAQLLQDLAKKYNAALLIVTHDQRLKDVFSNYINL